MKKKREVKANDDLRDEYDLNMLRDGERGKYYRQALEGTNIVVIEPELSELFPDSNSVNNALRLLAKTAKAATRQSNQSH